MAEQDFAAISPTKRGFKLSFNIQEALAEVPIPLVKFMETGLGDPNTATIALIEGIWKGLAKGFNRKPHATEEYAFEWLAGALLLAFRNVCKQHKALPDLYLYPKDIAQWVNGFEISLDFLEAPDQNPHFRDEVMPAIQDWLNWRLGDKEVAERFIAKLPRAFVAALGQLWKPAYQSILDFFENPIIQRMQALLRIEAYQAQIRQRYGEQAIFGLTDTKLPDLYIDPHFQVWGIQKGKRDLDKTWELNEIDRSYPMSQLLLDWVEGKAKLPETAASAKDSRLLLLLGDPGQGKSSCCYRFISDLLPYSAPAKSNVWFFELKSLAEENRTKFLEDPVDYIESRSIGKDILDDPAFSLEKGILVLDGLDELKMQENMSMEEVATFLNKWRNLTQKKPHLRVLISSRSLHVGHQAFDELRSLQVVLAPLCLDQQKQWLRAFSILFPQAVLQEADLDKIANETQTYKHVGELVVQPLLLQILTLAELALTHAVDKGKIYGTMFDRILARQVEKQEYPASPNLALHLRRYLNVLGFHIFIESEDYLHFQAFKDKLTLRRASEAFARLVWGAEAKFDGKEAEIRSLLVKFYFVQAPTTPTDVFAQQKHVRYALQFVHKSLQEYMAAEYIAAWFLSEEEAEADEVHGFMAKTRGGNYLLRDGNEVLNAAFALFGPKRLTQEVSEYLAEVLQNKLKAAEATNDQDRLQHYTEVFKRIQALIPDFLRQSFLPFPLDASKLPPDSPPWELSLRLFYGFLRVGSALIPESKLAAWLETRAAYYQEPAIKERPVIKWHESEQLKAQAEADNQALISRFAQRFPNTFIRYKLTHFLDENPTEAQADLKKAWVNLMVVFTRQTNLRLPAFWADLRRADLRGTNLSGADLRGADLRGTDLSGADLIGANLHGTDLSEANLRRADLRGTDLREAKLIRGYLREAKLFGSDLHFANLSGADLIGADLLGNYLSETYLNGAVMDKNTSFFQASIDPKTLYMGYDFRSNRMTTGVEHANWSGTPFEGKNWAAEKQKWEE